MAPEIPATRTALLIAALATFAPPAPADRPPDIILLESDDHHPMALGCMGDPVQTPHIDRLAARGVLFRNNVCQGTMCSPSRNSLLTGSYPHNTGIYHNQDGAMAPAAWTFPDALRRAGYATALVGKNHFKPHSSFAGKPTQKPYGETARELQALGFDRVHAISGKVSAASKKTGPGLDPYRDYLRDKGLLAKLEEDYAKNRSEGSESVLASVLPEEDWQDSYTATKAIESIREAPKDKPFLLWVDFVSPHPPADPPARYLEMYDWRNMRTPIPAPPSSEPLKGRAKRLTPEVCQRFRAGYYAMITALDAQVGRIVEALEEAGRLENAVIAFYGDQGSMLGDHGLWGKGVFYKGSINSPLIIAGPKDFLRGAKVDRPVELLDLAPTCLEIGDATPADRGRCRGLSLMPLLTGKGQYARTAAFAEREGEARMVVDKRYKWIPHPETPMLFDLSEDPDERTNLAGKLPDVQARLQGLIDQWLAATPPIRPPNPRAGKAVTNGE